MQIVIAKLKSILESPFQTEKVQEKFGEGKGFTLLMRLLETIDEPGVRHAWSEAVAELGVGASWWSLQDTKVYRPPYNRELPKAYGVEVSTPVFLDQNGEANEIMLSTEPECSLLRIYASKVYQKYNRRGRPMVTSGGLPIYGIKRPLIENAWCPGEVKESVKAPREVAPLPELAFHA